MKALQLLFLLSFLTILTTGALAENLIEEFNDPLGQWRDAWLAQNTNMVNYYIGTGGSTDEDYRGNNSCGLWIHDDGLDPSSDVNIEFDPDFGNTVLFFEIGIQAYVDCTLTVFDSDGVVVGTAALPGTGGNPLGCDCIPYSFNTPNGLGSFTITGEGVGVEGNLAIDDVMVTTGTVATENASWGTVKALYR